MFQKRILKGNPIISIKYTTFQNTSDKLHIFKKEEHLKWYMSKHVFTLMKVPKIFKTLSFYKSTYLCGILIIMIVTF